LRVWNFFYDHGPSGLAQTKQNLRRRREFRAGFHHWLGCTPRNCFPHTRRSPGCPSMRTSRRSTGCH